MDTRDINNEEDDFLDGLLDPPIMKISSRNQHDAANILTPPWLVPAVQCFEDGLVFTNDEFNNGVGMNSSSEKKKEIWHNNIQDPTTIDLIDDVLLDGSRHQQPTQMSIPLPLEKDPSSGDLKKDQVLLELQARAAGESDVVQLERSPSSSTLSYVICREKLDIVDPEQTEKKKLTEMLNSYKEKYIMQGCEMAKLRRQLDVMRESYEYFQKTLRTFKESTAANQQRIASLVRRNQELELEVAQMAKWNDHMQPKLEYNSVNDSYYSYSGLRPRQKFLPGSSWRKDVLGNSDLHE